jgi:hypothetical protein
MRGASPCWAKKRWLAAAVVLSAAVPLSSCQFIASNQQRYVDAVFPVAKPTSQRSYPHVVDGYGALWYIDGNAVVRQTQPQSFHVVPDGDAHAGNIFWYDGDVWVLDGDGKSIQRIGRRYRVLTLPIPAAYAPVEGVVADARHRGLVLAESAPHQLAVVDTWKWYAEPLPQGIDPFSTALAGGPQGKKYLIAGDQHNASIAIKNRWNHSTVFLDLPGNACFAGSSALHVPVDVSGRDARRAWVTSGEHVLSVDLENKRILRDWDLDGCAMQIVQAGPKSAVVLTSVPSGNGYTSSLVRVDRQGVQSMAQYGQIPGLGPGSQLDRFGRLWWFDAARNSFVVRTPIG